MMIGSEVEETLECLGLNMEMETSVRLGEILQMLVDDPSISFHDWRLMFHKKTTYLKSPLEKIWYLGNKELVHHIFHAAVETGGLGLPSTDWMTETLAEYIAEKYHK